MTEPTSSGVAVVGSRTRPRSRLLNVLGPLGVAGVVLLIWQAISSRLAPRRRFILPSPDRVWTDGFGKAEVRERLLNSTYQTARVALTGLGLAILIGVVVALLMSQAKWIERSVFPWAVALQTMPILALVPLIQVRWGYEFKSRVIVCVLISVFPIITNTLFGLQSADEGHHDLFDLQRSGRLRKIRKLLLPGALPAMFTGFRIAAGLSVVGAIVGEYFFRRGESGLGDTIETYRAYPGTFPALFATVIVCCLLGLAVLVLFSTVGNLLTGKWYESTDSSNE